MCLNRCFCHAVGGSLEQASAADLACAEEGRTARLACESHSVRRAHLGGDPLAAATSAAALWAREASNSVAAGTAGRVGGSDHGSSADAGAVQHIQQSSEEWQRHYYMQHAALYLGKVERLLPPAATASLDALEQEAVPSLLTALADVCRVTPESMRQYLQVLQSGSSPTAQACAWQAMDLL